MLICEHQKPPAFWTLTSQELPLQSKLHQPNLFNMQRVNFKSQRLDQTTSTVSKKNKLTLYFKLPRFVLECNDVIVIWSHAQSEWKWQTFLKASVKICVEMGDHFQRGRLRLPSTFGLSRTAFKLPSALWSSTCVWADVYVWVGVRVSTLCECKHNNT